MESSDITHRRHADRTLAGVPGDVLAGVRKRRRVVSQQFLWTLLALVAATILFNVVLLGPRALLPPTVVPNLGLCAVIGGALWLNHRHRFRTAWLLIVGVVFAAAALPLFLAGLGAAAATLLLFFVPIAIAGLLLTRPLLYATAGATLSTVLAAYGMQQVGLLPGGTGAADASRATVIQFAIVFSIVTFFLDRFGLVLHEALTMAADREVALRDEMASRARASEDLHDEKSFSDAVVESLPGIFYVIDEDGAYVRWNRNMERILGYGPDELAELRPDQVVAAGDETRVRRRIGELFDAGHVTASADLIAKDGTRIPYVFSGTRFDRGGASFLTGVGMDRSELDAAHGRIQALNAELQDRLERITALHAIDQAITGSADANHTLNVVLAQVTERLDVDAASILLYEPHRQALTFGASLGFRTGAVTTTNLRLGEGQAGRAARTREPVFIHGADAFAAAFRDHPRFLAEGFHAYAAVPLVAKGRLQGVLELFHLSDVERNADWHEFLVTLATQGAIALDNAAMFEELERSNLELRLAYDTTIEGWARALDLRDRETEGHSRRVTEMTERLATRLGMADGDLVHTRRGALLHDIGKMAVPDSILLKPGRLDPSEWETMKRHTTYGYELLHPVDFLRPALDIPYCHHERWDGSGYPQHLAGDRIPFSARVFAVVDVYDALTSDRPYRPAWSEERALAHIEEGRGSHFDPEVVPAFLAMVQDLPRRSV